MSTLLHNACLEIKFTISKLSIVLIVRFLHQVVILNLIVMLQLLNKEKYDTAVYFLIVLNVSFCCFYGKVNIIRFFFLSLYVWMSVPPSLKQQTDLDETCYIDSL